MCLATPGAWPAPLESTARRRSSRTRAGAWETLSPTSPCHCSRSWSAYGRRRSATVPATAPRRSAWLSPSLRRSSAAGAAVSRPRLPAPAAADCDRTPPCCERRIATSSASSASSTSAGSSAGGLGPRNSPIALTRRMSAAPKRSSSRICSTGCSASSSALSSAMSSGNTLAASRSARPWKKTSAARNAESPRGVIDRSGPDAAAWPLPLPPPPPPPPPPSPPAAAAPRLAGGNLPKN